MKKLLLTTAACLALSSSAFADAENTAYVGVGVGLGMLRPITVQDVSVKQKGSPLLADVLIGYKMMDNVGVQINYNHMFNPKYEQKTDKRATTKNVQAHALMAGVDITVADLGMAKLSVGADLGWAQVKEKDTVTVDGKKEVAGKKSKHKNNFAYALKVGAGVELAEGTELGLLYSWRDYGSTDSVVKNDKEYGKNKIRANNISLMLKVSL